jgi:hypothetical protein
MFSAHFLGVFFLLLMVNGENSRGLVIGVVSFVDSIVVQAGFLNTKSASNALEPGANTYRVVIVAGLIVVVQA